MSNTVEMADQAGVDPAPEKKKVESAADIEEPIKDWSFYFFPENISILLNRNMLLFSIVVGVYYCLQFCACSASTNFYSTASRNNTITFTDAAGTEQSLTLGDASAVLDRAILLSGIYHLIEWVRCTVLLTVICLGVNIMAMWYVMALNTLYSVVALIYCIVTFVSAQAQGANVVGTPYTAAAAAVGNQNATDFVAGTGQQARYQWLLAEICLLAGGLIFFFPPGLILCQGKEQVHFTRFKPEEEDDEEEDGDDED